MKKDKDQSPIPELEAGATTGAEIEAFGVADFEADAGAGMENVTADDLQIPFLSILQSNSPQLDESEGKYIDGAKAGMILNTVTNEIFDGKIGLNPDDLMAACTTVAAAAQNFCGIIWAEWAI